MSVKNVLSKRFSNGLILEAVYNPETEKTMLAYSYSRNDKPELAEIIKGPDGSEYQAIEPDDSRLKNGLVKLPSGLADYDSSKNLLEEINSHIDKYFNVRSEFIWIASLYVMMSWVYDDFYTLPYLRVLGNFGTGKSRFLEVVGSLCYKPIFAGGSISFASVYRSLEDIRGTLVFDEADFRFSEMSAEIVKILNAGIKKGSPVIRMDKDAKGKFTTQTFDAFGPKIIASREKFRDSALESRCLREYLLPHKNTGRNFHLDKEFEESTITLRNKLLSFRLKKAGLIKTDESALGEIGIKFPRLCQTALAIASLARSIDTGLLEVIRPYFLDYERELVEDQGSDIKSDVLIAIEIAKNLEWTDKNPDNFKLTMKDIANQFDNEFFEEYTGDRIFTASKNISPKMIGKLVGDLGFKKHRDGKGFYISFPESQEVLDRNLNRYGLNNIDFLKTKVGEINPEDISLS